MKLPDARQCTIVTVYDVGTMQPAFDVVLYGVTTEDVCVVPMIENTRQMEQWVWEGRMGRRKLVGAEYVRAALRRRGLDPDDFTSSVFSVRDGAAQRGYLRRDE